MKISANNVCDRISAKDNGAHMLQHNNRRSDPRVKYKYFGYSFKTSGCINIPKLNYL